MGPNFSQDIDEFFGSEQSIYLTATDARGQGVTIRRSHGV